MNYEARSLLDAFEPPDGLTGHTAVLVTMTADPAVLEAAVERFTGLRGRARARLGRRTAFLMRDAGSWESRGDVLSPGTVPGMHELRPRYENGSWPRLLHAKLALLAFSPRGRGAPTHARLVVTTGNFTRSSVQRMLELVYTADSALQGSERDENALADLAAAADFVRGLSSRHFQVQGERTFGKHSPLAAFDELLAGLTRHRSRQVEPRFFHSLEDSLFTQLRERAKLVPEKRNLLLCGSGFFETSVDDEAGPRVLAEIAKLSCLAQRARKVLIALPETSGQLRDWSLRAERDGWEPPVHAVDSWERRLHAKYILLGRITGEGANATVSGAHLYLGSGNLSLRGMLNSGRREGGNIECGVFFPVGASLDAEALQHQLFWSADARPIEAHEWREMPAGMENPPPVVCCPVLHALVTDDGLVQLAWAEGASEDVDLLLSDPRTIRVSPRGAQEPIIVSVIPASLRIRSLDGAHEWEIPVVDEHDRYAWDREPITSVDELLLAACSDVEDSADEEAEEEDAHDSRGTQRSPMRVATIARRYPLMEMAQFLEHLARLVQKSGGDDVDATIEHLERLRDRPFADDVFAAWRGTAVELSRHLQAPEFSPILRNAGVRERYAKTVESLVKRWGLR